MVVEIDMREPRSFKHFPVGALCPVCGTNEDAESVLLTITGTQEGNCCEAKPVHLRCAMATHFDARRGLLWSHCNSK